MTITRLNNDFQSLMNNFLSGDLMDWNNSNYSATNTTLPKVNIKETGDEFILDLAAPGMKKDDFNIEFDNGKLSISSDLEHKDEENVKYSRKEFSFQSFKRTFNVAIESVDSEKINAKYEDGILHITLPKREEVKPKPAKQITIA